MVDALVSNTNVFGRAGSSPALGTKAHFVIRNELFSILFNMFYTYIIQSEKDGSLYKGFTTNTENRLMEHNLGKSKYTSTKIPWKLIHIEKFDSQQQAVKREKYFKSAAGRRWIKKNVFGRVGSPPETT